MENILLVLGEFGVMAIVLGIVLYAYIQQNKAILTVIQENTRALVKLEAALRSAYGTRVVAESRDRKEGE